jgi:tetratricopeptide (TPR) repeat protein
MNAYQEALRLRADYHQARRGLGLAYMKMRRHEDAEREFRQVVESTPLDAGAHYDLGCALTARGRHDDALASYRTALRLQPGFAQARLALVTTLTDLQRPAEAIAVLQEVPRKDEPASATLGRQARAAHAAGQHAKAILLWTQALEVDPAYFDARDAERVLWDVSIAQLGRRTTSAPARAP